MKKLRQRAVIFAAAAALAIPCGAAAEEAQTEAVTEVAAEVQTEAAAEVQTEATTEVAAEPQTEAAAGAQAGSAQLSDKWTDFQLQIGDQVCQFPMMAEEWLGLGWTPKEEMTDELQPYQYNMYSFEKDGVKCTVYMVNLGINNLAASDCIVGGIKMDSFDWPLGEGAEIVLPGGLVRGQADLAAVEAAYGQPTNTYEGDLYTEYTYEQDSYCEIQLDVYKESGVLESISLRNFVEPEGFDVGTASEEVPETVAAYAKPASLSTDPTAYEIELDGQVYALPVPVSVLLADGWEINAADTEETVMAHSSGWVGLMKGGQSFKTLAMNAADYATIPENCWIDEISVGGYELDMEGSLPGGVKPGITEEEFLAILDAAGIKYEVPDDSSDFRYYNYNNEEYGKSMQVIVYKGEDGNFEKDTVITVTCSHDF